MFPQVCAEVAEAVTADSDAQCAKPNAQNGNPTALHGSVGQSQFFFMQLKSWRRGGMISGMERLPNLWPEFPPPQQPNRAYI
jgi:hypothetical protein